MGGLKMGLQLEELDPIKVAWRKANQAIAGMSYLGEEPGLWERIGNACMEAVAYKKRTAVRVGEDSLIEFYLESGMLKCKLPSGRVLCYLRPRVEQDERGFGMVVTYEGVDQKTRKWKRVGTYGGKMVENICQAIARDCLAVAIVRCWEAGLRDIVLHVHDEIVSDSVDSHALERILGLPISWAKGLLLKGEAEEFPYYRKGE
jgi:DNA polymerase